jgi:hypothetical protein
LHPNGDVYVADDPSFTCAGTCTPALLQGHLWRIPAVPAPPTSEALASERPSAIRQLDQFFV